MSCLPLLVAVAAFILSCFAGASCRFVQFAAAGDESATLQFGYWHYASRLPAAANSTVAAVTGSCELYPTSLDPDGALHAARVFNVVAVVLGGAILLIDLLQGSAPAATRNLSLRASAAGYLVAGLAAGLSLLILRSDACRDNALVASAAVDLPERCSIAQGGRCEIAATVLWLAAGAGAAARYYAHTKPEHDRDVHHDREGGLDEPLFDDVQPL